LETKNNALTAEISDLKALKIAQEETAPPQPPGLSPEQIATRDDLLAKGDEALKALRLTTPENTSALYYFRAALNIDDANEAAYTGLDRIVDRYVRLAADNVAKDNCSKASGYLAKARSIPESFRLVQAREQLSGCGFSATAFSFADKLSSGGAGPAMVTVPHGEFKMGSEAGDADEKPVRSVRIGQPFAISAFEVTFAQFDRFVAATGREGPNDSDWGRKQQPVVNISYTDAQAYVQWLSKQSAKTYRLPSEAEWEYAARGGSTTERFWGDDPNKACKFANVADQSLKGRMTYDKPIHECDDGHVQPAPVGTFLPNAFGLYDMLGNVWEWTDGCWNADYTAAPADASAVKSGDCGARSIRGGSWALFPKGVRAANRLQFSSAKLANRLGFRVVREVR
jgi:formylglycine-generating enzyme required for sulfatase activity